MHTCLVVVGIRGTTPETPSVRSSLGAVVFFISQVRPKLQHITYYEYLIVPRELNLALHSGPALSSIQGHGNQAHKLQYVLAYKYILRIVCIVYIVYIRSIYVYFRIFFDSWSQSPLVPCPK